MLEIIYLFVGAVLLWADIKGSASDVTMSYGHRRACFFFVLLWPFVVLGLIIDLWDKKD